MRRAGRHLLRQDRSDHLFGRIDLQRPLDRDQDIVRRREVGMAAPHQAAALRGHDLVHLVGADVDPRQHFHRVGGAGRRGDRARRSLGDGEAMRGHDRDDDHRGPVSRDAADAVLVDDHVAGPGQSAPYGRHRPGHREHFGRRREACAGDQEGRDLHLGIAVRGKVSRDFLVGLGPQLGTVDLGADMIEAGRRSRLGDLHGCSRGKAELAVGEFREAELIGRHDRLVIDDVQRGDDAASAAPDLDPGEGHELLRAIVLAAPGKVRNGLLTGIDPELADLEHA